MRAKMGMLVVLAGDKVNIVTPGACDIQVGTNCRRTVRRASRFVLVEKNKISFHQDGALIVVLCQKPVCFLVRERPPGILHLAPQRSTIQRKEVRMNVSGNIQSNLPNIWRHRLLHKIDFFILTYGCLAYFTKWLDQANLSNAYVSGMREDLHMVGTEYNLVVTCFQIGKAIFSLSTGTSLISSRPNPWAYPCQPPPNLDPSPHAASWLGTSLGNPDHRNNLRHGHPPTLSHPLSHRLL